MRTPPGLRPTWSTQRLFEAFSTSPSSSSHQGMSEGHVWTFEAGCVMGWDGMGGRRVRMRERKKGAFPSHRPIRQMSHSFISSACFTSQCKCGRMKLRLVQKIRGHWDVSFRTKTCRTQNTEHVHSTVSFIQMQVFLGGFLGPFFRHRVASGYTEHKATNRTRLDRLLQTTSFVYMLCMPHR